MSKKGNDTPASVRIRDNQRRSRNRRKELVEDLQARVKEYELKGVAATQQMQHAARYVALENTRLRTLLAQNGIQQAEVDAYLRTCDENEAAAPTQGLATDTAAMSLPGRDTKSSRISGATASPAQIANETHLANHTVEASRNHLLISKHQPRTAVADPSDTRPSETYQTTSNGAADRSSVSRQLPAGQRSEAPECPNTSDCFCPPTATPSNRSIDHGLEISCEAAASIIIEMRGEGDVDSIRASLGCAGRESCTVRNSTVLQVMDEG